LKVVSVRIVPEWKDQAREERTITALSAPTQAPAKPTTEHADHGDLAVLKNQVQRHGVHDPVPASGVNA